MEGSKSRILVVEDDPDVRDVVVDCLQEFGYPVTALPAGRQVGDTVARGDIDLVILDLGLPDMDGLALVNEIRARSRAGIIILSGRGQTTERIIGLEVGADDYLAKPFEPRELLARVRSLLRRLEPAPGTPAAAGPAGSGVYRFDGWSVDPRAMEVRDPAGAPVSMSSGEFTLLQALVERPNRVLSRDQLMDLTHGNDTPAFDRSVDVQVTRLRKKIEDDPKSPRYIKTVRNRGYMFTAKVTKG